MGERGITIGNFKQQITGSMKLVSHGFRTVIRAAGPEGALLMAGKKFVNLMCGSGMLTMQATDGPGTAITLQGGETGSVKLGVGALEVGAFITMEPESIKISVGAPGAGSSIMLTPESLTIKVGAVSYSMTTANVTEIVEDSTRELNADGHLMIAAETEVNIGAAGLEEEAPIRTAEIDGAATDNATEVTLAADAAHNVDAGVQMTE